MDAVQKIHNKFTLKRNCLKLFLHFHQQILLIYSIFPTCVCNAQRWLGQLRIFFLATVKLRMLMTVGNRKCLIKTDRKGRHMY
jgi:hypothetical protein